MASIYQRGKGQVWWISYSPSPSAKRIQKSLRTKDRTVARFRKNELENLLAQGESPLPQLNKPIEEIKNEYLERQKARVSRKQYYNSRCYLDQFFRLIKPKRLADLNDANMEAFFRTKNGNSVYMQRNAIAVLKAFLNWAVSRNYINQSSLKIKKPGIKTDPHRFLSLDEIKRLKTAAAGETLYPQILMGLYAGPRKSEIARVKWNDFNYDNNTVLIRAGKTKKFRYVPLNSNFKTFILAHQKRSRSEYCFPGYANDGWVNERRIIKRIKRKAKLKDVTRFWYTLRHTFGSHYYMRTGDLKGLSEIMGHSDIKLTATIYVHLSPKHTYDNIQKIDY